MPYRIALIHEDILHDLPEYNTSLPTGKTIGKVWRLWWGEGFPAWFVRTYTEDPDPKMVGIRTTPVITRSFTMFDGTQFIRTFSGVLKRADELTLEERL